MGSSEKENIQSFLSPTALVIFGITGDLAKRKLLPALFALERRGQFHDHIHIVGVSRDQTKTDTLLGELADVCGASNSQEDQDALQQLRGRLKFLQFDIAAQDYTELKHELEQFESECGCGFNRLYYLSIPPQLFSAVVQRLGHCGLNIKGAGKNAKDRLLVEKPFGYDLSSAQDLVSVTMDNFAEEQIYRIDHFLAKETAQNLLTFRFDNPLMSHIWHRDFISHVQITMAEDIGIEGRVSFYEQTGALRDVMQNHVLQLLALVAMEKPKERNADSLRAARTQLFRDVAILKPDEIERRVVRAQYVGDGRITGYKEDVSDHDTNTETYVAMRLDVDNDRWRGVPFVLRTGKRLAESVTEISMVIRDESGVHNNVLTMRIQPNEGAALQLLAKKPGFTNEMQKVDMDFCYERSFLEDQPAAYERVLLDAMRGDQTLFTSSDEVLQAWRIVEPALHHWHMHSADLHEYAAGSWGPEAAKKLIVDADFDRWLSPELVRVCRI